MISTFTAFFDANVFFSTRLRSAVLWVAQAGLFRARWSEDVHREWMSAVVAKRPHIAREQLEPTRRAMDAAVRDYLVTGYEPLIDGLKLPDANDRHILAAAIVARASVIVTFNGKHFPEEALAPYGIHPRHPDAFLQDVADIDPAMFAACIKDDLGHYLNPPLGPDDYLNSLRRAGIPGTADFLEKIRVLWA